MFGRRLVPLENEFVYLEQNTIQVIANVTTTVLTDLVVVERGGIGFNEANNNYIVNVGGLYLINFTAIFEANVTGQRRAHIRLANREFASNIEPANNTAGSLHRITTTTIAQFNPTTTTNIDFGVYQSSGGVLDLIFASVYIERLT